MRLQQAMTGVSRKSQFVHVVVKVSLIVLIGLFFVGGFVGVSVKGAHAQSAVGHSISQTAHTETPNNPPAGSYNWFPYPACTWWADQRYHELHGVYVPWRTQANAWEWTARAQQFGWKVSTRASMGAIINLQPWVQGAYGLGHVAVVEKVYGDGSVLASNMSWGSNPYSVVYVHFYPGSGVTFIQI
ncbi:MAG: CHAP domain-containing protein [Ktedonobacteraceae bacterium]